MFLERRANLGLGGCCFEGEEEYLTGTEAEIIIPFSNRSSWIPIRGTVLGHTHQAGRLGVRCKFYPLPQEHELLLAEWLEAQLETISMQ